MIRGDRRKSNQRRRHTIRALQQDLQRPDTAEQIAERIKHRQAAEVVAREVEERFGKITPENVADALAFQERRLAEIKASS